MITGPHLAKFRKPAGFNAAQVFGGVVMSSPVVVVGGGVVVAGGAILVVGDDAIVVSRHDLHLSTLILYILIKHSKLQYMLSIQAKLASYLPIGGFCFCKHSWLLIIESCLRSLDIVMLLWTRL